MTFNRPGHEFVIKDTHRGLWYEDGALTKVLGAGRYKVPALRWWFRDLPKVECVLVDMRERDLTIKGQEILTADKVAIRVSILVQFCVTDAKAAVHTVESYEDRLYSDVQLAARRALAAMMLEEILTNRNRLSEELLADVKEAATSYGVAIRRADVKDLIFPGNLQEIMNRVLAAERKSQAELVEARTRAEVEEIEARSRAEATRREAAAEAEASKLRQTAEAEASQLRAESEARVYEERQKAAEILERHPSLLRLAELETLRELAGNANARIYLGMEPGGLRFGIVCVDDRKRSASPRLRLVDGAGLMKLIARRARRDKSDKFQQLRHRNLRLYRREVNARHVVFSPGGQGARFRARSLAIKEPERRGIILAYLSDSATPS